MRTFSHYALIGIERGFDYRADESWSPIIDPDMNRPVEFTHISDMREYITEMVDQGRLAPSIKEYLRIVKVMAQVLPVKDLPKV